MTDKLPEEKQSEWQPIESAPRDETDIFLYLEAGDCIIKGHWYWNNKCYGDGHCYRNDYNCAGKGVCHENRKQLQGEWSVDVPDGDIEGSCGCGLYEILPTHWMPLPKPPIDNNK